MMELLSPAGSYDALRAAVCNGADAVYLGVEKFNARRAAKNFLLEDLPEAVRYCHVRGVKVYLTLNTLIADREMPDAAKTIARAAEAGVDAFIVGDLGVLGLCRQIAPDVPLHASTQMNIFSYEGVVKAGGLGFSRVILAREASFRTMERITRQTSIPLEVFVHGALCMSYSGQCYMSSVIGRCSGNRGMCKQPCRLPYGFDHFEEKYPLSLKDNCLVDYIQELKARKIASLKIEGRMKRPEYVAAVTRVYRRAIDGDITQEEAQKTLRAAFSRDGFTQAYFFQEVGPEMFGTRTEQADPALLQAARATYENVEVQRVPVHFTAAVMQDRPVMLAVQDEDGNLCKTAGALPEHAVRHELTQEELTARLEKTGGTPYLCKAVRCVVDRGLNVPAAEINRLRREVLTQLSAVRGRRGAAQLGAYSEPQRFTGSKKPPELTVSVLSTAQITPRLREMKPAVLYVPIPDVLRFPWIYEKLARDMTLAAVLPRAEITEGVFQVMGKLPELGIRRVLLGNLGQIPLAEAQHLEIAGDFGLNLFNSRAMDQAKRLGLVSATASFELSQPQLRDLSKPLPVEMFVYGRLPLMLTKNCLIKNRAGKCTCGNEPSLKLVDRMGEEFRVVRDCETCCNVILNGKKLYLLDKREAWSRLGLWAARLSFTTENRAEVDGVLAAWNGEASFDPGACTRGLFYRGVE